MTTQLPHRPFRSLPAPPDGLASVRHEARRRRRRRATAVAAGGAGIAAVAAVVTLSTAGAGLAVLQPDRPAGGGISTVPSPTGSAAPGTTARTHGSKTLQALGATGAVAGGVGQGRSNATGTSSGAARRPASTTRPGSETVPAYSPSVDRAGSITLRRYRSTNTGDQVPAAAALCSESAYSGGATDVHAEYGWCLTALAKRVTGGEELTLSLCRDHTGAGTVTFPSSREVDLAVRAGGRTVWNWAADHPGHPDNHTLSAPRDGCWNWSLVWPDVTNRGVSAGRGSFTLVVTTTATEMQAQPTTTAPFRY